MNDSSTLQRKLWEAGVPLDVALHFFANPEIVAKMELRRAEMTSPETYANSIAPASDKGITISEAKFRSNPILSIGLLAAIGTDLIRGYSPLKRNLV